MAFRNTPGSVVWASPPVGTIYALNFGATGQGATITEYDGKDKGNASPLRTLSLDKKLYAVSLAVDSNGNIYVGYFDNSMGYNPANGSPDPGNEIAIYAPNASKGPTNHQRGFFTTLDNIRETTGSGAD